MRLVLGGAIVVVLTQTDTTLTLKSGDQAQVFPLDGSENERAILG